MMTMEQKFYSMTMKALVAEAEKLGVKIDKKGSKAKAVEKMLAAVDTKAEETVEAVEEKTVEVEEETVEAVKKEEPKKERKARQPKRTFENLLADIPSLGDLQFVPNSKRNAVHVKRGNKRIFGYNGAVLVVNRREYLDGVDYETKNYGYVVAPTRENMLLIQKSALAIQ